MEIGVWWFYGCGMGSGNVAGRWVVGGVRKGRDGKGLVSIRGSVLCFAFVLLRC